MGPSITSSEIKEVSKMMKYHWDDYSYVEKFEKSFSKFHKIKFGLMTPSCTMAIHLILKTLKIKKGDEIIVPASTWTATVAPAVDMGIKIVFCDVDEKNWCIDINQVKKKISKKTKALISVDLYGLMPNYKELSSICKKKKIFLIEDAAEALGSKQQNKLAGTFGDASVFSFHRTKTITSGEGGFLLIKNKKIFERAKFLRDLGRSKNKPYYADEVSLKYMPSNLQASVAYAQFKRIKRLLKIKKKIMYAYVKYFNQFNINLFINKNQKNITNGNWMPTIVLDKNYKITADKLIKILNKKKIPCRVFFSPLPYQKGYKKLINKRYKFIVGEKLHKFGLSLPCHYNLKEKEIFYIVKNIHKILMKKNLNT